MGWVRRSNRNRSGEKREAVVQEGTEQSFLSRVLSFLRGLGEAVARGVAWSLTVLAHQTPSFLRKTLVAPLVGMAAPTTEVTDCDSAGVTCVPAL